METVSSHSTLMGTAPIPKLLRKFALPSCISLIVNAMYNIVDQIFIGRGVGYLGNGATNVLLPFTVLAIALALLFGDGCSVHFSAQLGRGKKDDAAISVGNATSCMLLVGIILTAVLLIFLKPLCRMTGATDLLMPYALSYGRPIAIGLVFAVFDAGFASVIRADGSPLYSMLGLIIGCIVNVVLDYVFVFPLQMGVFGAALATMLGQIANAIVYLLYIPRMKQIRLKREHFKLHRRCVNQITKFGVSSFITQFSVVVMIIVLNKLLVHYGGMSKYGAEIPMTALGVTMKINNILMAIMMGIGAGALPIISFNYGAGHFDRVKKTVQLSVGIAILCGVVAKICFVLFPEQIVGIFGAESNLYTEFGVKCLTIYLMFCFLDGMNYVIPTCFQAMGKPAFSAVASLMRQLGFNMTTALIFPIFFGVEGCLYNGAFAQVATFVLNIFLVITVMRKLKKELSAPTLDATADLWD